MTAAPAPLEWHPAYRNLTGLLDWLDDDSSYPYYQVPVMPRLRFEPYDPEAPIVPDVIRARTLRKQRAQGLAPYVGRPFIYRWNVGTDELGRHVAGESRIEYIDHLGYYWGWREVESRNGHAPVWP